MHMRENESKQRFLKVKIQDILGNITLAVFAGWLNQSIAMWMFPQHDVVTYIAMTWGSLAISCFLGQCSMNNLRDFVVAAVIG